MRLFKFMRQRGRWPIPQTYLILVLTPVLCLGQAGGLSKGPDPKLMAELKYAEQLNSWGMPDYAQVILNRLPKSPEVAVIRKRLTIEALVATGKFDEVKNLIAREGDQTSEATWGMKLALADGYYAWGKYNEAQEIYNSFFAKYPDGPPKSLNDFYMDSAYKYSQMLLLMGDKKAAMEAYRNLNKAKLPRHVERQIMSETAELMLVIADDPDTPKAERDKLMKEVEELCNKILWVQDLWFGKAVVYLAHMALMKGDAEKATKLIDEYKKQLMAIDAALQEQSQGGEDLTKLSPMAQCRYLIGKMMQEEAEKQLKLGNKAKATELFLGKELAPARGDKPAQRSNGALHHFINVFIRYPNTSWAPDAGARVDEIKKIAVEKLGAREIKFEITDEQWENVRKAQFQEARSLFNRQLFEQAVEAYIKVLNLFPEGETSVRAISELARCYIELEEEIDAKVALHYLAECFSKRDEYQALAGDKVLSIAGMYEERGLVDEKDEVHNIYFKYFTKHSRAPAMLFQFGEKRLGEENYSEALGYYNNIVENHKHSNLFIHSLYKVALCYGLTGQRIDEIKTLQHLIKYMEKEGEIDIVLLNAKFGVAQGYRELAKAMLDQPTEKHQVAGNKYMMAAASKYLEITKELADPDNPYAKDKQNEEARSSILEGSIFFKAYCYTLLTLPTEKVDTYKQLAIEGYEQLVKTFPKSKFAPQALSQIATLYTLFGKAAEAEDSLQRLKKEYPQSPEAENADFALGMNLLKMGKKREAIRAFTDMISGKGKYSAKKILIAGNELMKVDLNELALEAFDKVLTMSQERALVEPARVGQGQALTELGQYAKAVPVLDRFMIDYPKSGYTPEAGFFMARAASEVAGKEADEDKRFDMFNQAVSALKRVQKHAGANKDDGLKAKTSFEAGRIFELKAKAEGEFGTPEKREQYEKDAIGAYQVMMMFADHRNPEVRPHLEKAFTHALDLMFQQERWADVVTDAEKYETLFPTGQYASEIRTLKNKAIVKQRIAGEAAPTTVPTEGSSGENKEE